MIQQIEFSLKPVSRGFHLVTGEIVRQLPPLPRTGIVNLFVKHTSCGLCINENADPVRAHGHEEDIRPSCAREPALL